MRTRPDLVTLIAAAEFVTAALLLLGTCVVLGVAAPAALFTAQGLDDVFGSLFYLGITVSSMVGLAIVSAVVGWGLLRLRSWARLGAMILAVLWLAAFPIWTVLGILVLIYLMGSEAREAFGAVRAAHPATASTTSTSRPVSPSRAAPTTTPPPEPSDTPTASEVAAPAQESPAPAPPPSAAQETREMRPEDRPPRRKKSDSSAS